MTTLTFPAFSALLRSPIRAFVAAGFAVLSAMPTLAHPDMDMDIDNFRGEISVTPAVAEVGSPRKIVVSGVWHDSCVPVLDRVDTGSGVGSRVVNLRFIVPATLVACAQVETPFEASVVYAPTHHGDFNLYARIGGDDRVFARGKMFTLSRESSAHNSLSGLWLSSGPASALMITQSETSSDSILAQWGMYAHDGTPHWQLLHTSKRSTETVLEAVLEDFRSPAIAEPLCNNAACPAYGVTSQQVATAKLSMDGDDALTIEVFSTAASHPHLPAGTWLFKTAFKRVQF